MLEALSTKLSTQVCETLQLIQSFLIQDAPSSSEDTTLNPQLTKIDLYLDIIEATTLLWQT